MATKTYGLSEEQIDRMGKTAFLTRPIQRSTASWGQVDTATRNRWREIALQVYGAQFEPEPEALTRIKKIFEKNRAKFSSREAWIEATAREVLRDIIVHAPSSTVMDFSCVVLNLSHEQKESILND